MILQVPSSPPQAAKMHVTMQLLGEATEYMRAVEVDRRRVPSAGVYAVPEMQSVYAEKRDDTGFLVRSLI